MQRITSGGRGSLRHELKTLAEASEQLGLSHWTLKAWIKKGRLNAVRLGGRLFLQQAEIDRVIEEGTLETPSTPRCAP